MSKSFKKIAEDVEDNKPFRIAEVEKGRFVKRTFNKDNSYKDVDLDKKLDVDFPDVPY